MTTEAAPRRRTKKAQPTSADAFAASLPRSPLSEVGRQLEAGYVNVFLGDLFLGELFLRVHHAWRADRHADPDLPAAWALCVQILAVCEVCIRGERAEPVRPMVATVDGFDEVARCVGNGYPVAFVPAVGLGREFQRDAHGRGGWLKPADEPAGWLAVVGVRGGDDPAALVVQFEADGFTGPADERLPEPFQRVAGWVTASDLERLLTPDAFALAGKAGFAPSPLSDWTGGVLR